GEFSVCHLECRAEDSYMRAALRYVSVTLLLSLFAGAQSSSSTDLQKFLNDAEARLNELTIKASRAAWVQETYITDDTEAIAAAANENLLGAISELASQAKRFEGTEMSAEQARKLKLLKLLAAAPAPSDPKSGRSRRNWAPGSMAPTAKASTARNPGPSPESALARVKWNVPWQRPKIPVCCSICGWD